MSYFDIVIAGGGVVGLSIARALLMDQASLKVLVVEKEDSLGLHASGRNSGVLHAGFYYSPESLKAKFCREGNLEIRNLAERHSIPVRNVGKVVVARNSEELIRLETLFERGKVNGVKLELLDVADLPKYEPLAKTHEGFLWSPTTGVSDPALFIQALKREIVALGVEIRFESELRIGKNQEILVGGESITTRHFVNAAGTQSDRLAHRLNVGMEYSMIPFMGIYRAVSEEKLPLKTLVYPVPHALNPFLGVHFTLTSDFKVKIGPTAIPIFGREQYNLLHGWSPEDIASTSVGLSAMLRHGAHDLPSLIRSEWPKIMTSTLVREACDLVPSTVEVTGWIRKPPGIRAQLIHRPSGRLEQDFIVAHGEGSTHVLNAVSPGWTSAIPFGKHISGLVLEKL